MNDELAVVAVGTLFVLGAGIYCMFFTSVPPSLKELFFIVGLVITIGACLTLAGIYVSNKEATK